MAPPAGPRPRASGPPGEGQRQVTAAGAINRGARQPRAGGAGGAGPEGEGARGQAGGGGGGGGAAAWARGGPPAGPGARADGPGPGATARTTAPCGRPAPPAAVTCWACGRRPGERRPGGGRGGVGGTEAAARPWVGPRPLEAEPGGRAGPQWPSRPLTVRGPHASRCSRLPRRKRFLGASSQGPEGALIAPARLPARGPPRPTLAAGPRIPQ